MSPAAIQLLLFVGAAWLIVAVVLTGLGVRRSARAARDAADARAISALLAAAPMTPLLVYPDGRIDADPRIADRLALAAVPQSIAAFDEALAEGEPARLDRGLSAAFETGAALDIRLATCDGDRTVRVCGAPYAAPDIPSRALLLWVSDVTAFERETVGLRAEAERLSGALEGLSVLIEAAPFPIWHRGPDLGLALVNDAYVRAVEASDAADVVARGLELVEPGRDGTAVEIAQATMERGTVASRAAPAIVAGQRRMMRVVDVPIGLAGVAGFAMDMQDLEDARADLARLADAQRDMLDRLSAGVAQFGADHGLVFFNRHFERMFALKADWLADRPEFDNVLERMREAQRLPESRDFRVWKEARRAWFQSADPVEETWVLPTNLHLRVVAQPMPDGGLLLIFEDRTEHLQLASRHDTLLRVREATFDNLFEAVGVFAQDGRLQLWNTRFSELWELEETVLGEHPRVDMFGRLIADRLVDRDDAKLIEGMVRAATVERQQRSGRILLRDGRHFQLAAVPLPDGNALLALIDTTASRGIEDALRDRNAALDEANMLKSAFVADMSRQLRDPLNAITGYVEMLAGGYAGELPPVGRDYVAAIVAATQQVSGLINDQLDLSQSEVGELPLSFAPIAVAELVEETVRLAREPVQVAGLTLSVRLARDGGTIEGDPRRLAQCLDHLLRNAIAHTPAGGRILVEVRTDARFVSITVADSGPGMTPEELQQVTDRLGRTRLGGSDVTAQPHRGVGLPLARQLVEAHGGTLEIDSAAGRGTRVVVRLPLAGAEE